MMIPAQKKKISRLWLRYSPFSHLDPFGNYLCQKLLDYCNDEQRTIIVETVAKDLVGISLNMHGTRAVQKMIESLSTSRQVRYITMVKGVLEMIVFIANALFFHKDTHDHSCIDSKCCDFDQRSKRQPRYPKVLA